MLHENFKRYNGFFVSMFAFSSLIFLYLILNFFIQGNAIKATEYESFSKQISIQLASLGEEPGSTSTNPESESVKRQLLLLKKGGSWAKSHSQKINFKSANQFLSPNQVNIDKVINLLNEGRLKEAGSSFQAIHQMIANKAAQKVRLVSTLQLVAGLLIFVLFCLTVVKALLSLPKSTLQEMSSRKENENIMKTVSEGIFLIDREYQIGIEQSASLREIFRLERDLEGGFFEFIGDYTAPSNIQLARDYIRLLFGDRIKEKLVKDLNPLVAIEINIIRRDGSYESRYLDFNFKRVLNDGKVTSLMCSVSDITKQVKLEQQLKATKEEQEAQLELLMSILHIPKNQLDIFFQTTKDTLTTINTQLENNDNAQDLRVVLSNIGANIHRVKGDSAALGLHQFEFAAHEFENELQRVRNENKTVSGKALLNLVTLLREMFKDLNNMETLVERFASSLKAQPSNTPVQAALTETTVTETPIIETAPHNSVAEAPLANNDNQENDEESDEENNQDNEPEQLPPTDDEQSLVSENSDTTAENSTATASAEFHDTNDDSDSDSQAESVLEPEQPSTQDHTSPNSMLENLVKTVAEREQKQVNITTNTDFHQQVPEHLLAPVNSIVNQLVRNAIVHGIETPEQRQLQAKSDTGQINVHFTSSDKGYALMVQDDGAGINEQKVIQTAIDKGIISAKQADKLSQNHIASLLFRPEFSTCDEVGINAGRGEGLSLVKQLLLEQNGKMAVQYEQGSFTRFKFLFPSTLG